MSEQPDRKMTVSQGGVFYNISNRIKLIIRLVADPRVSPLLKVLPIGSLLYFIIPDLIPTPVDDAALIWIGTSLFVELCPPEIVQEHEQRLGTTLPGQWTDAPNPSTDEDVIDAEFTERP